MLGYSNVIGQQPLSNNTSDFNLIEMDLDPDQFKSDAASKQARPSRFWFPERRVIFYRSTKHQGGWAHLDVKKTNRLKKNVRARVIADCRVQHFDECRRDVEALANQEFERVSKEHSEQLDSQRSLAEEAIQEARGDRANLLESIRSLEHDKKVVESEAKVKDQQIRDLKADLQKHNVITERAVRKAQANSEHKSNLITDLEAENASLKEKVDNVKKDLKASTAKVENLEMAILERQTRTEARQQAQSIRNLTSSLNQLKSNFAEQAQTLVDCKNNNNAMMQELAHQRSENTVLEGKLARLRKKFSAKKQMKEGLVKDMAEESADDLEFTASASAETVPRAKVLTAITSQDEPTLPGSRTLVTPAVASPTASSVRNILGNLILLAYCFLFSNPILSFGLVSLLFFSGTKIFFSASNIFNTDLSAEEKTGPSAIGTDEEDRKIASMPGG